MLLSPQPDMTPYQAKYFAHELKRRGAAGSLEKIAGALADAKVDLNPHQVEAALFAFKSPLSNGAILADEVGLGKTIEAGILLSQFWAEGKQRILLVMPASLRKQWSVELAEYAFGDRKSFKAQYSRLEASQNYTELQERLRPFCHRTLRRQVLEFIRYTDRIPLTEPFEPGPDEQTLYELVNLEGGICRHRPGDRLPPRRHPAGPRRSF